jgi:excisionase family DNA binding protein
MSVDLAPSSGRLTYTVEEAAEIVGVGRSAAYAAVRAGDIPSIRVGRRLLVPRRALERLLGVGPVNGETPGTATPGARETTSGATDAGHVVQAY